MPRTKGSGKPCCASPRTDWPLRLCPLTLSCMLRRLPDVNNYVEESKTTHKQKRVSAPFLALAAASSAVEIALKPNKGLSTSPQEKSCVGRQHLRCVQ